MQAREKLEVLFFEKQIAKAENRIQIFLFETEKWLAELKVLRPSLMIEKQDFIQILIYDQENRLFCVEKHTFIEDNPKCFQIPISYFFALIPII